jgi:hypothetical protein
MAHWLRCRATNRKVAGSIPAVVSGIFIDIKSFRSHYGPGVDSASNRNEYLEYFLFGKGDRCVRLTTLPPSCAVVTKSGTLTSWNPLGLSRPVMGLLYLLRVGGAIPVLSLHTFMARTGTPLPLPLLIIPTSVASDSVLN